MAKPEFKVAPDHRGLLRISFADDSIAKTLPDWLIEHMGAELVTTFQDPLGDSVYADLRIGDAVVRVDWDVWMLVIMGVSGPSDEVITRIAERLAADA